MTDIAIAQMTLPQVRAAASELLDNTDGDLAGADAERFAALTRRADQLRRDDEAARDILDGVRSGRYLTEGEGSGVSGDRYRDQEDRSPATRQRDAALRTLERHVSAGTLPADSAELVEGLVEHGSARSRSWAARWAAVAGSEHYRNAFAKRVANPEDGHLSWTAPESEAWRAATAINSERAMSLTDTAGGYLAPLEVDYSIRLTNGGTNVPLLDIARVIPTTSDVWSGINTAGVSAEWLAEAAEAAEATPVLASPTIPAHKMSAFAPYSVELEGDAVNLLQQLGTVLFDAAETLLATALTTGSGDGQPTGIVTALAASAGGSSIVTSDGSEALAASDFYKLQNALGPRYQPNARFMASLAILNAARQFETGAGALKFPGLHNTPPSLLGRPVHENSVMDAVVNPAATEANYAVIYGDFSAFTVTLRVGAQIELVPHIVGANRRPTGQRGAWLWGRYGSDCINDAALNILNVATTA